MIDDTIARVKDLIKQREEIDAELAAIFGVTNQPRRGRPRKAAANGGDESNSYAGVSAGSSVSRSVPSTPSGEGEPPAG